MKILSIHWGLSIGGVARYATIFERISEFSMARVRSLCILPKGRIVDKKSLATLNPILLPLHSPVDFSWIFRIRRIIKHENPDCLISHGFNAHFVSLLCGHGIKKPVFRLATYHGSYHAPSSVKKIVAPVYNLFTHWFLKIKAASVLCVAQFCADFLVARGVPKKKLVVVHNGISDYRPAAHSRNRVLREWGVDPEHIIIGSVSRLDPVKGLDYLLDAFVKISNDFSKARLVMIGDGHEHRTLKKKAAALGIKNKVIFAGIRSDISRCLTALDIFVLPSLAEYHSIGLLEAMRAGLPSVVTDVGGNRESVRNGREGLVVQAADANGLADAISWMLGDAAMRKRFGIAARNRYVSEFLEDKMVMKTAEWLKSVNSEY